MPSGVIRVTAGTSPRTGGASTCERAGSVVAVSKPRVMPKRSATFRADMGRSSVRCCGATRAEEDAWRELCPHLYTTGEGISHAVGIEEQGRSLFEDTEFSEEAIDLEGMGAKLGGDVGDAASP